MKRVKRQATYWGKVFIYLTKNQYLEYIGKTQYTQLFLKKTNPIRILTKDKDSSVKKIQVWQINQNIKILNITIHHGNAN